MCHVLILDDDELFGRTLADSLRFSTDLHFNVIAATTPEAARQAIETANSPFDAFLVDQRLRDGEDGIEAAQELMQLSPNTSLIVFTGYDDPEVGLRAYQAHAYRYLPKPFQTRELIYILRAMQEWRTILNEHDWLRILNQVAEQAQQALSVQDVGEIVVNGGLKLGFERARLWLTQEDGRYLRCGNQVGCDALAKLVDLVMPLTESVYILQTLNSREPIFFQGQEGGAGFLEKLLGIDAFRPPVGEWTAIPLWAGDQCLGSLVLDNAAHPVQLNTDKRRFLRLFGSQAAVALERARLFELEKRRSEELAVLNQIGRDVTALDDLDELLRQVHASVGRLLDVNHFRIALVDEETAQLDFRLCVEEGQFQPRYFRKAGQGLTGYLIKHNQPIRLLTGTQDFRSKHHIRRVGPLAKSWLGVPLRVGGQAVGAITIQDYGREHAYSQKDEDLLMAAADQVAGVIKTARLKEREAKNVQQLQILHQAGEVIMKLAEENEDWLWHAALTITTAQYGLSFNRAILLLLEDNDRWLRGRVGIGHFSKRQARHDWRRDEQTGMKFDTYLAQLMTGQLARTPIESAVSELRLPVNHHGNALTEAVRQTRRIIVAEADALQRLPTEFTQRFGLTDYAIVPLRVGKRVLGVAVVDNYVDREPLWPPDLNRLESFLAQVALVAENVRQRRAQDQLLDLNYAVLAESTMQPLQEMLTRIARGAYGLAAADCVTIYALKAGRFPYEYDEDNVASIGRRTKRLISEQPRPRGITGHILRTGQLVVPDVDADTAHYDDGLLRDSAFIQREEVKALIGIPIRNALTAEILGVMYLDYRTPRHFADRDLRLAELFANLAAAAIRNSRATQQMKDGLQAAETRGQASERELRRLSDTLEEALTTIEQDKLIRAVLTAARDLLNQSELRIGVMLRGWNASALEPCEVRQQYYLNRDNTISHVEEKDVYRGLIGVAIRENTSVLVQNVSLPEWQTLYHKAWPDTQSELVVPIGFSGQVIGAINAESPAAGALTRAHQDTLERLANTAALALDNVRRQAHLHSILSAATAITLPVELQATLQAVVNEIQRLVPALSCLTIWYREPSGDRILPGPSFGVRNTTSVHLPLSDDSVVHTVMRLAEPIWARTTAAEPQLNGRFIQAELIASTAAFPLRADNETVGAMFFNYRQPHDFTTEEVVLFPILVAIVAASVRDATHLEGIRRAYRNLDTALAITQAVSTSLDLNDVLGRIMNTLCGRFAATACVLTYDEAEQMLVFQPASRQFYFIDELVFRDLRGVSINGPSIASAVSRQTLISRRAEIANVGDVEHDARYLRLVNSARSELCISLVSSTAELLGVVVLESPERDAFAEEEVQLMASAAQQISLAIERVNQSKQLRFKSTVATATAWASDIAHEIRHEVSLIRNKVARISRLSPLADEAPLMLAEIDASADRLAAVHSSSILTKDAETKEFELDSALENRVREIIARAPRPVDIQFDLGCTGLKVEVRQPVFGRVLRHLVRNALKAMRELPTMQLRVRTRPLHDRYLQVFIEDAGPGVSNDVRPNLFEVPTSDENGHGLLFVRAAVEDILHGRVWYLPRTDEHGPTFTFTIPMVVNHTNHEE